MTLSTKKNTILERYHQIRSRSLEICRHLHKEDFSSQPVDFISPPKWHLGHTSWFFENFLLAELLPDYKLFNPRFNYCFNSYYESQGDRILRSNRGNLTRPSTDEIFEYRAYVDEHIKSLLNEHLLDDEQLQVMEVGLQHEQQHQELLRTDIKYILGNNPMREAYIKDESIPTEDSQLEVKYLKIPEGIHEVGYNGDGFAWDNELSRHKVYLQAASISNRTVTNKEYLEFINDGGYENHKYWLSEGWAWLQGLEEKAPMYWYRSANSWKYYTLFGMKEIHPDEPVTHISYYEADAYAQWKGQRLATEFEWEVACGLYEKYRHNNLEKFHVQPQQANSTQFIGNVWEWTASAYLPYPNYSRFNGALGEYNGKFMVSQMVLRGGSCATPASHIRPTYRNFFHPGERWQFTGIRLAK